MPSPSNEESRRVTNDAQPVTVNSLLESSDRHRANNDFDAAIEDLDQAIGLTTDPEELSHIHMRLGRMYNGAGAYHLSRGNPELAKASYSGAEDALREAFDIAMQHSLDPLTEKGIALQQYFTATGLYQVDPDTLPNLVTVRGQVQESLEKARDSLSQGMQGASALVNPEAGEALPTVLHELAYIIDDRPEGEDSPLTETRREELTQSVELYTEALAGREGKNAAMTFSRRLSPTYKLGGVSAALSDLEMAVHSYIQSPDGQRFDILERDLKKFLDDDTASPAEIGKLGELLQHVQRANIG